MKDKLPLSTVGAITLFQAMFLYSGSMKIINFEKKVQTLIKKIQETTSLVVSNSVAMGGMIGVIVLELVGSLTLIGYSIYSMHKMPSDSMKRTIQSVIVAFIVFVAIVTFIYHPWSDKKIPFLSNMTTLSGFVLMHQALDL